MDCAGAVLSYKTSWLHASLARYDGYNVVRALTGQCEPRQQPRHNGCGGRAKPCPDGDAVHHVN